MVRQRRDGDRQRDAPACAVFAFGHKSLPNRITSARREKVTRGKRRMSFHPPPYPNRTAPFLNGNLLSSFPAPSVHGVVESLWLPANRGVDLERIWRSCKSGVPP